MQRQSVQRLPAQREPVLHEDDQAQTAQQPAAPKQNEDRSANRPAGKQRNVNNSQPDLTGQAVEPRV